MIEQKMWVEDAEKDLRRIWEGLFFGKLLIFICAHTNLNCFKAFWHSDKPVYQKNLAEQITSLMTDLKV